MNWATKIDYVEAEPLKRRGTKKKIWDQSTNSWQDVTIWTVPATRDLCDWLKKSTRALPVGSMYGLIKWSPWRNRFTYFTV